MGLRLGSDNQFAGELKRNLGLEPETGHRHTGRRSDGPGKKTLRG